VSTFAFVVLDTLPWERSQVHNDNFQSYQPKLHLQLHSSKQRSFYLYNQSKFKYFSNCSKVPPFYSHRFEVSSALYLWHHP